MDQQTYKAIIQQNPFFNFTGKPLMQVPVKRPEMGKEAEFYSLFAIVLFFALIKVFFNRYIHHLFAVFFQVSLKQKQMREQLMQTPLASLLLNLLFFITGGMYIKYLLEYYAISLPVPSAWLMLYCTLFLVAVYLIKTIAIKATGFIFNVREATDVYIFIVFLINKLIGILLMPVLLFMAFSSASLVSVVITLSYIIIFLLFAYRYIISYAAVRKEIKVSPFHFFLYLCAFEITPLIVLYKLLLEFVKRS